MRLRVIAIIAAVAAFAFGLTACSEQSHVGAQGKIPAVSGDFGARPTVAKGQGEPPAKLLRRVLHKGNGPQVAENDSVAVDYLGQTWPGKVFDTTFKNGGAPLVFSLNQVVQGWKQGLTGAHVGDRVELVIPPQLGYGDKPQTNPRTGEVTIPAKSTLVFVVDIHGRVDPTDTSALEPQNATPVPDAANKLPAGIHVSGPLGKKPQVNLDAGVKLPDHDQLVVLAQGKGAPIGADDYAVIHVTAKSLDDASGQVSSTWDAGSMQLTQGPVGNSRQFYGVRLGTRAVWLRPAGVDPETGQKTPGGVYVIDYGGKLAAKR